MAAEKFPRRNLKVDRLYYNLFDKKWFYTPDGIGVVYFEDAQDARNQTDMFGKPVIMLNLELSDEQWNLIGVLWTTVKYFVIQMKIYQFFSGQLQITINELLMKANLKRSNMPIKVKIERVGYYEQYPDKIIQDLLISRTGREKLKKRKREYEIIDRENEITIKLWHKIDTGLNKLIIKALKKLQTEGE